MTITNLSNTQFSYTLPDGSVQTETRESNLVNTEVLTSSFTKVKGSNKTFLQEGENATQTVTLTNGSLFKLSNMFFADTLSSGASYVPGTVFVNGVSQPTYDVNAGFPIDDMEPNDVAVINYDIKADNPLTQPIVNNFATINYTAAERPLSENTNTIQLAVVSNRLSIVKSVDKPVAIKGENLHYTNTITNTGTLLKTNLIFTDAIPAGSTFVVGSVKVDGVPQISYNPETGFPLADLAVGASTVVEFDVTVN